MNKIHAVIRMYARDHFTWFILPWGILLSSFFINIIIAALINEPAGMKTGGIASIAIYLLIAGIMVIPQTFHYAIGLSVRRKDYYVGTGAMFLFVSLFSGILISLLAVVERDFTNGWGVKLQFFNMPFLESIGVLGSILFYTILLLSMFYLGMSISSIHRRFGRTGLYTFFGIGLLLSTIFSYMAGVYGYWNDLFNGLLQMTMMDVILLLAVLTAVCAGATYLMLRRATTQA
ncbi:hypothetical protein ACFO9Q_20205 [Paenibacillus sp. GCM10023252]|uniref:hypothetical protein n=1 Tax=Paenibacillus sp. GCM10023252 TaxID=3252649 RepID=UPI00361BBBCD